MPGAPGSEFDAVGVNRAKTQWDQGAVTSVLRVLTMTEKATSR